MRTFKRKRVARRSIGVIAALHHREREERVSIGGSLGEGRERNNLIEAPSVGRAVQEERESTEQPERESVDVTLQRGVVERGIAEYSVAERSQSPQAAQMDENVQSVRVDGFGVIPVKVLEKLGESTFSEIFIDRVNACVYKILPLTWEKEYKRVQHTKIENFVKECRVMEEMNISDYSVRIHKWWIVEGEYPAALVAQCRKWAAQNEEMSENIPPHKKNCSGLFGVIQMEYAGAELAQIEWQSVSAGDMQTIIDGIKLCVQHMEILEIEHRDLHESNLLVLRNKSTQEYEVKAIDYSLARMHCVGDENVKSVRVWRSTKTEVCYVLGDVLYTDLDNGMSWLFDNSDGQPHRNVYLRMDQSYRGEDRWRSRGNSNKYWEEYLLGWVADAWKKSRGVNVDGKKRTISGR